MRTPKQWLMLAALAAALPVALVACGDDDDDAGDAASPTTAAEETATMDGDNGAETGNIVEVATSAGSFTTLLTAAEAAGLVETLTGEGPYTVFAPTDEAFAELGSTVDDLLANPDELRDVLLYHVVEGEVTAAEVVELDSATTVQGDDLAIMVEGDTVMVNDATVVQADVMASNGVIHVIDKVLVP